MTYIKKKIVLTSGKIDTKQFNVSGIDKNIDKIRKLRVNAKLVYEDDRLNKIVKKVLIANRINFTNKIESVSTTDIILICIKLLF